MSTQHIDFPKWAIGAVLYWAAEPNQPYYTVLKGFYTSEDEAEELIKELREEDGVYCSFKLEKEQREPIAS